MKKYNKKRFFKISFYALLVLFLIGIFCYINISPVDAISGATQKVRGLQEDGAISHLISGEGR